MFTSRRKKMAKEDAAAKELLLESEIQQLEKKLKEAVEENAALQSLVEKQQLAGALNAMGNKKSKSASQEVPAPSGSIITPSLEELKTRLSAVPKVLNPTTAKADYEEIIQICRSLLDVAVAATSSTVAPGGALLDEALRAFETKGGEVNSKVWLQHAEAAKEALGPGAISVDLNVEAQKKTQQNIATAGEDVLNKSRAEVRLDRLVKEGEKAQKSFRAMQDHLSQVRLAVAERVGHKLVADVQRYQVAMDAMIAEEPEACKELTKLAADIANATTPVVSGEIVEVVVAGSLARARVEEVLPVPAGTGPGDAIVRVSTWKVVNDVDNKYEEGFDTRKKQVLAFPRREVYSKGCKIKQRVTEATVERVCRNCQTHRDPGAVRRMMANPRCPEFLLALYADAKTARADMEVLGREMVASVGKDNVAAMVPACKGIERATVKTMEKYRGEYDQLTDLARMTFDCRSFATARTVLQHLHAHHDWRIVRVKDRLMQAYDASPTGGYRDMLLNAVHAATGHVVEIQITLSAVLEIKTGGGHAVYKLARLLELNAPETTEFSGEADAATVEKIGKGLVREVNLNGARIDAAVRDSLLSEKCLQSQSCAVVKLHICDVKVMTGEAIFDGWALERVLPQRAATLLGPKLKFLEISNAGLVGEIPPCLLQFVNLEHLDFSDNKNLGGLLPADLGLLKRLKDLQLWGCSFNGEIPKEFGQLQALQKLGLSKNQLSGAIPKELGQLQGLKELYLHKNQLSGAIPKEFGQLQALQELSLYQNQLSGAIPKEFGQLQALQRLYLWENQLSGAIPKELGQLQAVERLSLSKNQLSGAIPKEFGQLHCLKVLNLFENQLSGAIPKELGQLQAVETLDLSKNQLSGAIPKEFGQLQILENLHLYQNQLTVPPKAPLDKDGDMYYNTKEEVAGFLKCL